MRRIYFGFTLILLSVLFYQCQKEVSYIGGPDPVITTPAPITAHIQGNILDENEQPSAGVLVRVGNKTATTDNRGYFRISAASLDQNGSVVTAEKSGYFKSYRVFSATSGANNVRIKLVKKDLAGTIDGTTGGDVTLANGSKVALQPGGVVMASNNQAYTGAVRVYAAYIDPSAGDIGNTVPGSFLANDRNNNRVVLTSYGMLAVELESPSGDKLQVKTGSPATLTTAIPASLQATAPATIPMWYVDEQTGVWKEEGSATRQGNVYVGEVKHFSFWNCDVSQNAVRIRMTLRNAAGTPLVHASVRLRRTGSNQGAAYGYTDTLGRVGGFVPNSESLVMEVIDECGAPFFTQNIGPFTQSTDIGVITVNNTGSSIATISGKLLNCSNAPVTNGFAIIRVGYVTRYAAVNATGNFETTITTCASSNNTYEIIGIDSTTQQQSAIATGTLTAPATAAGNISACGTSITEYINYTIDGTNYSIGAAAGDSLAGFTFVGQGNPGNNTQINGRQAGQGTINTFGFSFMHAANTNGTYNVAFNNVRGFWGQTIQPSTITITNFPQVGGFYEGNLSGQLRDSSSSTNKVITATFRVRRLQ